jgi:hypothetical protein
MRLYIVLSALAAALAIAPPAQAGGWATMRLDPLPGGVQPSETWRTEITVLQHGRTPLEGLSPLVTIREQGTGDERTFTASATATAGVYEAAVIFPTPGSWTVAVDSGFWGEGGRLTFGPETIAGSPPATGDGFPLSPLAALGLALALVAAAAIGARRLWRPSPVGR